MRNLIGASVFSAAGSLPLQILPFLVLTLVAEGRINIAFAGWVGSIFLIGMLSSALLLPTLRVSSLNRWHGLIAIFAIILALIFSVSSNLLPIFLALWFVVGFACGALQFLGATTAAKADNKPQAFALRLAIALVIASTMIVILAQFSGQKSYTTLAYFLICAFGISAFVGAALYKNIVVESSSMPAPVAGSAVRNWSGLMVVFAFFVGQPGFWAYAMQSASQRGLNLVDASLVIAFSKIISALVLFYISKKNSQPSRLPLLMLLGGAIAAGILVMTYSSLVVAFFVGFLIWELALNVLSARLQGLVVAVSPGHAGAWITGAILLGSAAGPVMHGVAIGGGVEWVFIAYAAAIALLPFLWVWAKSRDA